MADRGDRGDVDDRAAALLLHHRNHVLHGEVDALEIDGEDAVPLGLRHLDHAAHLGDADIVVEHVDAPVGLQAAATIASTSAARETSAGGRSPRRPRP